MASSGLHGTITKVTLESMVGELHMFNHFRTILDNVSLAFIDKTDPSGLIKREDYWRRMLKAMSPFGLIVWWNRCEIYQFSASLVKKLKFSGIDVYHISNTKEPGHKSFADHNITFWRPEYVASLVAIKTWSKILFQHILC